MLRKYIMKHYMVVEKICMEFLDSCFLAIMLSFQKRKLLYRVKWIQCAQTFN